MILDGSSNIVRSGSASYSPSDQKLSFPLSVGKTWSASYVYSNGNWKTQCDRDAESWSRLNAYWRDRGNWRVRRVQDQKKRRFGKANDLYGGRGVSRETDWYAPAVGRIVKQEYQDSADQRPRDHDPPPIDSTRSRAALTRPAIPFSTAADTRL